MARYADQRQKAEAAWKYFGSTIMWVLITIVLTLVIFLWTIRIGVVGGDQVGVLLNNFSGEIEQLGPGTHIYTGIVKKFYVVDKKWQRHEMASAANRGDMSGNDELQFKTIDGSNVRLDLTIVYEIDLASLEQVVYESGPGDAYKQKWVRDYSRSICRDQFGELTTEEFYDASQRSVKMVEAREELNRKLNGHGIRVTSVNLENFHFYKEYEDKIKEKKLADQEVEEYTSVARAALQNMERLRVEATKKKEVQIKTFDGKMQEEIVQAGAEANAARQAADAYSIERRIGAEAKFYSMEKEAQAILARQSAEAEGIAQMAKALEGSGGVNLVMLEYVGKLNSMRLTGQPYMINAETERFYHTDAGAARRSVRAQTTNEGGVE